MVKLEEIIISELRGIRSLTLNFARKNFVIYGPNGSGKSGVIDAIQFGLTGKISRLSGRGTGQLTFQKYGPHVDSRHNVSAVEVTLKLYFPRLNKTIVLKRNAKSPSTFSLDPDNDAARAIIEELARFPKLALSRREIIEYILVEAGERAKQIQTLLKIKEINDLRSILLKSKNQAEIKYGRKKNDKEITRDAFLSHLNLTTMLSDKILEVVNEKRKVLSLPLITELKDERTLATGITRVEYQVIFNKATAIRDIEALQNQQVKFREVSREEVKAMLKSIGTLEDDPSLFEVVQKKLLIERGLDLVDGPQCPLCDKDWEDEEILKAYLRSKIEKSNQADEICREIQRKARAIINYAQKFVGLLAPVKELAVREGPKGLADKLTDWEEDLREFVKKLTTVDDVISQKPRLNQDWMQEPCSVAEDITTLAATIKEKPDQSSTSDAHQFLILAEDRHNKYLKAKQDEKLACNAAKIGRLVYDSYVKVSEKRLKELYETVEADFSNYYRILNDGDESGFNASLEPTNGKLNLDVAFYDKGSFPPAAYHSEGHQDGMGVCLYLALMQQLMGSHFTLAMLDDVVMSIDRQHRKQFCRLLKKHFPETQFIITTHDKVWAKQMQTESLVTSRGRIDFNNWSVQTGPVYKEESDVWDKLDVDLAEQQINTAAARLRRHLEYVFADLAERLGASVPYRSDQMYDLGIFFGAVISRHGKLLKRAKISANSWNEDAESQKIMGMEEARSKLLVKHGREDWLINKAVHYNEWANFSREEFREVIRAFRELLLQFRCSGCNSWLYISPRTHAPESLRCDCNMISLNLKPK